MSYYLENSWQPAEFHSASRAVYSFKDLHQHNAVLYLLFRKNMSKTYKNIFELIQSHEGNFAYVTLKTHTEYNCVGLQLDYAK